VKVFAPAPDAQTAFAQRLVTAPGKKVNVAPEGGQFAAIKKTDRSRAYDGDAKIRKLVA
jgi:hypothetical protein